MKDSFYPLTDTQICKNSPANSLLLNFLKGFQSLKSRMIRFGVRSLEICYKKYINFELFSQITSNQRI